jgi:hypothetical protein
MAGNVDLPGRDQKKEGYRQKSGAGIEKIDLAYNEGEDDKTPML